MDLWELAGRLASIVLLDLVLSGDNAVVIGMATSALPPAQRRRAILLGGGGAVVLRILFTILAALLLGVPLLMAAGGVLLAWIALKLLRSDEEAHRQHAETGSLADAVRTIIVADVVMSLDNMLAVGGAAHGEVWLLLFGLLLSIPILLLGSGLVAALIDRISWLDWVGAAILSWTAGAMIAEDPILHPVLGRAPLDAWLIPATVVVLVLGIGFAVTRSRPSPVAGDSSSPSAATKKRFEVR